MKVERMILVAFLGNYLINNDVAGLASLVPPNPAAAYPMLTVQYGAFALLAMILIGLMAWWYFKGAKADAVQGAIFGVSGFIIMIVTAFNSGVSGILVQTGSLAQVGALLPNFGPYLMDETTWIFLALWVIPSTLVGWFLAKGSSSSPSSMSAPSPMI